MTRLTEASSVSGAVTPDTITLRDAILVAAQCARLFVDACTAGNARRDICLWHSMHRPTATFSPESFCSLRRGEGQTACCHGGTRHGRRAFQFRLRMPETLVYATIAVVGDCAMALYDQMGCTDKAGRMLRWCATTKCSMHRTFALSVWTKIFGASVAIDVGMYMQNPDAGDDGSWRRLLPAGHHALLPGSGARSLWHWRRYQYFAWYLFWLRRHLCQPIARVLTIPSMRR